MRGSRTAVFLVSLAAVLSRSESHAFVRSVEASGTPLRWPAVPITYVKNSRGAPDTTNEFAAIDAAFSTWASIPNSTVSFTDGGQNPAAATVTDGLNTVVWLENPSTADGGSGAIFATPDRIALTRRRSNGTGDILEADILLNGVFYSWSTNGSDNFSGFTGPMDIQSILTHEIGHLLGLDHVTTRSSVMFVGTYPGDTTWRALPQDELSAAQAIYPSGGAPPNSSISGRVIRSGGIGVSRALLIAFQNGIPVASALADASGNYRIDRLPPGNYLVRLQPYTRASNFGHSAFYQTGTNVDVDFLSQLYAGVSLEATATTVTVTAGADTPNINFTASATGNADDFFEQDDTSATAKAITVNGLAHLKHSWASADEDWVSFTAVSGRIYVIETGNLGIRRDAGSQDSATFIELRDQTGSGMLASNVSPNPLEQLNTSRIVRSETASALRFVRVRQRNFATIGAGAFYDLRVTELAAPFAAPTVSSVTPTQATEDGGVIVTVRGNNIMPGAEVMFGAVAGTDEEVQECVTLRDCRAIKVRVPAQSPAAVMVQVTNIDGQTGSLPGGFTYTPRQVGTFTETSGIAFGEFIGRGQTVCWGDYDGDGDPDLYAPYRGSISVHDGEFWRNNGDGTFADVTAASGLDTSGTSFRFSCSWADYDDDGDLDLYVVYTGVGSSNRLYQNNGANPPVFTNVAAAAGVVGNTSASKTDAAWSDYDGDGDLDLYLVYSSTTTNQLFRNNGNGTFTDVAVASKVNTPGQGGRIRWADYDNDGRPDFYAMKRSGQPDLLFHNDGGGVFSDVTSAAGIIEAANCSDVVWADFNNDKLLDILCAGDSFVPSLPQKFWINQGNGTFVDQAAASGINSLNCAGRSAAVLDRDNDGDVDAFFGCDDSTPAGFTEARDALLDHIDNSSPPAFTNVAVSAGTNETNSERNGDAVAAADFNGDGATDIIAVGIGSSLNDDAWFWRGTSNTNQSVTIRLAGTVTNSWGIGAEVTVISDLPGTDVPSEAQCLAAVGSAEARRQEVIGGSQNQSSMELEFGLMNRPIDARQIDCVIVSWPRSGLRRAYSQVATTNYLVLSETVPDFRVTRVSPTSGTTAGGTQITIFGFNFDPAALVFFDGVAAGIVSREGTNIITVTTPVNTAGPSDVEVRNPGPVSATLFGGFTYIDPNTKINILASKDIANSAVDLTWMSIGQQRYRVRRATGPTPADFSVGFQTVVPRTDYQDTGKLSDGVNYFYLVDEGEP